MAKDIDISHLPPMPPKNGELAPADIAHLPPMPAQESSMLESGLRGAGQGATMGFGDELVGAFQAVPEALTTDQKLSELYAKYRDIQRAKNEAAEAAHPWAYGAGQVGGGIATMAIPGVVASKVGGLAGKAAGGIAGLSEAAQGSLKGAAALGGVTGLGLSKEDLTSAQGIKGNIGDIALGTAGGSVGYGIGKGISSLLNRSQIAQKAELQAAKAMGVTPIMESEIEKSVNLGTKKAEEFGKLDPFKTVKESGRLILEEDLNTGDPLKDVAKLRQALDTRKEAISPILADAQKKFNDEAIQKTSIEAAKTLDGFTQDIHSSIGKVYKAVDEDGKNIMAQKVMSEIDPFIGEIQQAIQDGNLAQLQELKQGIGTRAYQESAVAKLNPGNQGIADMFKKLYGITRRTVENAVENSNGQGKQLGQLNHELELLYSMRDPITDSLIGTLELPHIPYPGAKAVTKNIAKRLIEPAYRMGAKIQHAMAKGLDKTAKVTDVVGEKASLAGAGLGEAVTEGLQKTLGGQQLTAMPMPVKEIPWLNPKKEPEASTIKENHPSKIARDLYSASDDDLKEYIPVLEANPAFNGHAKSLQKALEDKDSYKKNSTLFALMQNKDARKLLHIKE